MSQNVQQDTEDTIEILESYVLGSRLYAIIDNPTDVIIPEG